MIPRPWHPLALAALAVFACGGSDESGPPAGESAAGYAGIKATLPTGSADISGEALAAAYDLTTLADGLLRDFGPHGIHGSPVSETVSTGIGAVSEARIFRTVEDRIHLPSNPAFDLAGPLTVAAWVRVDSLGLHQHIVACDDRWALWVTPDDRYRLGDTRGGGWSTRPGAVAAGAWAPVVAVLRGTAGDPLTPEAAELWVDGVRAEAEAHLRTEAAREAAAWSPGGLYPSDACSIGYESHQGVESHRTLPFVGAIDEILVFGRAWSEAEVRAFSTPATPR